MSSLYQILKDRFIKASYIDILATIECLRENGALEYVHDFRFVDYYSYRNNEKGCNEFVRDIKIEVDRRYNKDYTNNTLFVMDIDGECFKVRKGESYPSKWNDAIDLKELMAGINRCASLNSDDLKLLKSKGAALEEELYGRPERDRRNSSNTNQNEEENSNMKNLFPELKCGKVEGDVRMCHLGVAVKNTEGIYVAYDKTSGSIVNVDIASVEGGDFLYQIPVQIKDIKTHDHILHNGAVYVITATAPVVKGIRILEGTEDVIKLTKSMFGFDFITKIVSIMDMAGLSSGTSNDPTAMLPLLLLGGDDNDSNDTIKTVLMMQMFQQNGSQQTASNNMLNNPMMLALLAGNEKMDTGMLLAMSMMQQTTQNPANAGGNETNP